MNHGLWEDQCVRIKQSESYQCNILKFRSHLGLSLKHTLTTGVQCANLTEGSHSTHSIPPWYTGPLVYGDIIERTCDSGYVVRGSTDQTKQIISCGTDGQWQPQVEDCWGK